MPQRSFNPVPTTIVDVIGKHLSVPKYQRPYTWSIDNIELLWEDLYLDNETSNFLGIVVLHDNGSTDDQGTRRIEIIDGQQRITTITIFLALIRNLYIQEGNERLANTTQNAIEKENALGSEGYILRTSARLKDFFETYIQERESQHEHLLRVTYASLTDEQEKIVRNYRKAYELLTEHDDWKDAEGEENNNSRVELLTDVKNRLLNSEIIEVTVRSEDDAYDLFETLNSRSVSLSEVNMIKNRIFMMLSSHMDDEELERIWGNIEVNAGGDKRTPSEVQKFINYFWWSRYAKIPPKEIFRKLRNESDLEYLLGQFEADSSIYNKLKSQDSSQLIQYRHISLTEICTLASILNMQQVYIPLLSLARKFDSHGYWEDFNNRSMQPFIRKLEKFIFAYKFSERSPAALERVYSRNAISIFNSSTRSQLVDAILDFEKDLNAKFPKEEEFRDSFSQLTYIPGASQNNKIISYSLEKIYFGDNPEVRINAVDIDHIFPQHPNKGFAASEVDIEAKIHHIGNLTPLQDELNRNKCQNKRPNDKVSYYRDSNIIENHKLADLIDRDGWNSESIIQRDEELITRMWEYLQS